MKEPEVRRLSELFQSPELIDQLGRSFPGLVYVYDLIERRNVYASRSMTEFLGYSAAQVIELGDQLLATIIHPDDMPRAIAHHARMPEVKDGQVVEIEYRLRAAGGVWRWVHSWDTVLKRDAEARPRQLLGIAQDVTARVKMEAELRESQRQLAQSEQRWRSIVENPFDFVVVIDREYKYTFVNFVAPGLTMEDLIGKRTPFDFVAASDHAVMRAAFEVVFNEGRATSYEVQVPVLDKWYSSLVGPIREGDQVTHASVLTREITSEKRLEAQALLAEQQLRGMEAKLAQSSKLEAVGQLAGGIAHDFNNLLTGIAGVAEVLALRLNPGDPSFEDVKDLRDAVERGAGLTRQLLAFSRQQPITPTVLELNGLVEQTTRLLRQLLGKDVELQVVKAEAPLFVRCDRTQLEQVLLNLTVNARDAMPGGGGFRLELGRVTVSATAELPHPEARPGSFVQLAFSDTGVGMDLATQARMFEPFFTTKALGAGTGLGLSMVYGIVRQAGGFIQVRSAPGQGTRFQIHLPEVGPVDAQSAESASARPRGDERILVVEDEALVLRLTRRLLETLGYRVETASRGDEALQLIQSGLRFDLLLTDILLPGLDGNELYQQAARLRPGLPVLFMSGYTDGVLPARTAERNELNFLQKPFSHAELAAKVRAALDAALAQRGSLG